MSHTDTAQHQNASTATPSSDDPGGISVPKPSQYLSARHVTKRFGGTVAVREVDFSVAPGEVVAILGPSGSGKSTLLYLLSGVLVPDEGEVWFGGMPVHAASEDQRSRLRRSSFGFVFQFGQLIPELTAQENVALPLWLERQHNRADAMERAKAQLDHLGIGGLADRLPGTLSGGEAQRVAVARAFVIEPDVVFADEPTGSLDSTMGELVMESLTKMAADHSTSVVVVTHSPQVASHAHRRVTMRDGRLSEES
jgi:putative ABC transport system ATP-binding protein